MAKKYWIIAGISVLALIALIVWLPPLVWGIIGWIFLGLLILLLLLLFVPVMVRIMVKDGEFSVKVRVLFITIGVLPAKKKEPKEKKKQEPPPPAEPEQAEEKPKRTVTEILELVKKGAESASPAMRLLLKWLRVYDLELVLPVHAQDAAAVAIRCGQMHALVASVHAALRNILTIRFRKLEILPDFTGKGEQSTYFSCKIAVSPVIMIAAGILGFTKFLALGRQERRRMQRISASKLAAEKKYTEGSA